MINNVGVKGRPRAPPPEGRSGQVGQVGRPAGGGSVSDWRGGRDTSATRGA